jgi:hypothetical protein
MGGSSNPNDSNGSRFTVTKDFIDSIYRQQPNAKVGLIVFAGHLFFDKTTGQYFTKKIYWLLKIPQLNPDGLI